MLYKCVLRTEKYFNLISFSSLMRLILLRHGETDDNVGEILQGHKGKRLNHNGITQAEKTAFYLKDQHIDIAFISDLERTIETSVRILRYHPHTPVVYTSGIRERSFGISDGRKKEEMNRAITESGLPFHKYKPPEGESSEETQQRGLNWYEQVLKNHHAQNVLAISHGAFSSALLRGIFEVPFDQRSDLRHPLFDTSYRIRNCSVTIINHEIGKIPQIELWNYVEHLQ